MTDKYCKGMNCGIDPASTAPHSLECQAEHVAAMAGGRFVKEAAPQPPSVGCDVLAWLVRDSRDGQYSAHRSDPRGWAHGYQVTELVDRAALTAAQARIQQLEKDKERLDAIESGYWDVRYTSSAIADTGDYSTSIEIIGHWMDKPHERVIGENWDENLRAAIDQAMTADAYPPARPEYPEIDAALAEQVNK